MHGANRAPPCATLAHGGRPAATQRAGQRAVVCALLREQRAMAPPHAAAPAACNFYIFFVSIMKSLKSMQFRHKNVLKDPSLGSDTTVGAVADPDPVFRAQRKLQKFASGIVQYITKQQINIHRMFDMSPCWRLGAWLRLDSQGIRHFKRLATSPHDPLGITDSACKNQLVVVSVQYGPFNTYIPIRSTTIGKSRVARDPITMHTSWRSNSDITGVTSIGYPRIKASGESSTTKHRLLHASGPHPILPPNDPKYNDETEQVTESMRLRYADELNRTFTVSVWRRV
ncbi:carboxyl-terminal-processing peptidase 1, chloroplastic [Dorcoceras hygrometricum]|uniref:Carboxyl-terminal-processing peptidase 1, chloroplastic n=1 Tax=Dorcoceras hygrometricum TaxID=472368 RepID=A0A2Z7CYI7_9LAMI|nr:carboxyl-terminal-processing peptidase 1, chloroplastic [Dorcoceras hygrometricum]